MLKMSLMCLAVISGCTGATSGVDIVEAEVAAADPIPVAFADGSLVYAGEVQRLSSSSAQVEWWWVPNATSRGRSFEVRMFPTDGGKAVRLDSVVVGDPSGPSGYDYLNTALNASHAHWVSVRLVNEDGKIATPFGRVSIGAVAGSEWIPWTMP